MAIIDKPSGVFNTKLYTGNGSSNAITGVGFQPNFTWIKNIALSGGYAHSLFDSLRGANKRLKSNSTNAEETLSNSFNSFNSDGFTLGADSQTDELNKSGAAQVSWNWKEQPGVFDIVSFTGNGNARTISHNLGVVPKFMIIKDRDNVRNWGTYHVAIGPGKDAGYLNNTVVPEANNNFWNNTAPTASVFSVGTDGTYNGNGNKYIIYLFGDSSMSKLGSYTGNGSGNGPFIYTGFKPSWLLVKLTSGADDWQILDNRRNPDNTMNFYLRPNSNGSTVTNSVVNFLSNGFKLVSSAGSWNPSGGSFIYMAFAENPLVTSTGNGSIPACAR